MFLKQVTIDGFKSFADKTVISLPRGITCIVGPNGCGKSNIVDAIRWVLGEQSAKSLRGGKMQDVIFQGTETRKPMQFGEVSLIFSDCEKELGTQFNEVEITRKVFRDGGSEYLINGKSARLKDIQQLFMNTGVGRVSYSFMVQGQIDQILSSNPGERRAIFEEAAGITKYKTQRREALNKLALVEQNLARATDRMEEISRQIGTLKRQASKALRYKRLSFRLRHLDLALNAKTFSEQSDIITSDAKNLGEVSSKILESSSKLSLGEENLLKLRTRRAEFQAELERLRQNAAEVRSAKEQAERNSEFAVRRSGDMSERISQIETELKSFDEQLAALEDRARGDLEVKQMQLDLVSGSDEILGTQSAELEEIERRLRSSESELSNARRDALVAEGSVARLRSNCTTLELDLKSFQVRHAALGDAIFQLKEESEALAQKMESLKAALESSNEKLAAAEEDLSASSKAAEDLRTSYRDKQAEIQNMDRVLAGKSARLSLLNDFQNRLEGFSEGVKAMLKGKVPDILPAESVKIVSQSVDVAEGWTSSFETMLGSAVDAVALSDASKVSPILEALKTRGLGKACLHINTPQKFDNPSTALPQGVYEGAQIVKAENPELESFAKNFIKGCYFCDDISIFADFILENPEFKFFSAVDKNGNMMDSRGIIYASTGEKSDTESSFILRTKEIKRLKEEIETDNNSLTALNEAAMQIQSRIDANESDTENRKALVSEIRREISSINAQIEAANSNLSDKSSELEKKNADMSAMENSRFEAQDKLERAAKELSDAEGAISSSRALAEEKEKEISQLRTLKDEKYAVLSETRLDLASKRARLESLEKGLGEIENQRAETRALIERRKSELDSINSQIKNLSEESKSEKEKSEHLAESLNKALADIGQATGKISECENSVAEFESELAVLRESHIKISAAKNELDVRIAQTRAKIEYVAERILSDYEVAIGDVDWKRELWLSDEEFEIKIKLDELEDGEIAAKPKKKRGEPTEEDFAAMDNADFDAIDAEVKELRERISAMGAVNLVAIEEYAELKERHDFLKTQTDDLWKSKNDLVTSIDEINETSLKLFSETFEQIRKNFVFTFQKVFGGGIADLKLVENEDALDSGIEIVARPPGTMLKSLSLLSGGQRTMTAVSLLFAIYMVKPSPFCVLDELDAPLDDANISRYTDLLKEFTRYSQFLVISHNKHTVSAADTIYGVTMQERGVTRMISMRFADVEKAGAHAI